MHVGASLRSTHFTEKSAYSLTLSSGVFADIIMVLKKMVFFKFTKYKHQICGSYHQVELKNTFISFVWEQKQNSISVLCITNT